MTPSPLTRFAGPIAICAAVLVILTRIVQLLNMPADLAGVKVYVAQMTHGVNSIVSILAFALLIVAVFAVYGRLAREAGTLGAVGVVAVTIGTVFMAGDWWYEAFAVPWMADIAPAAFVSGPAGRLLIGGVTSFALFAVGWVLFAIASLRAGVFPTSISVTILLGGVASGLPFGGAYLIGNTILGFGIGWLGLWMMRSRPAAASEAWTGVPA